MLLFDSAHSDEVKAAATVLDDESTCICGGYMKKYRATVIKVRVILESYCALLRWYTTQPTEVPGRSFAREALIRSALFTELIVVIFLLLYHSPWSAHIRTDLALLTSNYSLHSTCLSERSSIGCAEATNTPSLTRDPWTHNFSTQ